MHKMKINKQINISVASTENDAEATLGVTRNHISGLRICDRDTQYSLNKRSELDV